MKSLLSTKIWQKQHVPELGRNRTESKNKPRPARRAGLTGNRVLSVNALSKCIAAAKINNNSDALIINKEEEFLAAWWRELTKYRNGSGCAHEDVGIHIQWSFWKELRTSNLTTHCPIFKWSCCYFPLKQRPTASTALHYLCERMSQSYRIAWNNLGSSYTSVILTYALGVCGYASHQATEQLWPRECFLHTHYRKTIYSWPFIQFKTTKMNYTGSENIRNKYKWPYTVLLFEAIYGIQQLLFTVWF